jgi:hypothetical protein
MKCTIFWDITPRSPLKALFLSPAFTLFSCWLIFRPWTWRRYVPPKSRLTFNGLQGIISQKMVLFITTDVRTPNPTILKWFKTIWNEVLCVIFFLLVIFHFCSEVYFMGGILVILSSHTHTNTGHQSTSLVPIFSQTNLVYTHRPPEHITGPCQAKRI